MKNNTKELLESLTAITEQCIADGEAFKNLCNVQLNFKQDEKSWSILECLEHLNLYGDFYLDEIAKQINNSKHKTPLEQYKSSMLGNYFAKAMKVEDNKIKTMKTFVNMDPKDSNLPVSIVDRFIKQQQGYLELIEKAKHVNLNKTKTSITISKLIKLRLCDTLMVVIYHNERHIWQAKKVNY